MSIVQVVIASSEGEVGRYGTLEGLSLLLPVVPRLCFESVQIDLEIAFPAPELNPALSLRSMTPYWAAPIANADRRYGRADCRNGDPSRSTACANLLRRLSRGCGLRRGASSSLRYARFR